MEREDSGGVNMEEKNFVAEDNMRLENKFSSEKCMFFMYFRNFQEKAVWISGERC